LGSTYLTGWTVISAEIAQICPGCFGITATDGLYSLDLTGYHDSAPYGGVSQTIATTPGETYTIQFDVGSLGSAQVQVSAGSLLDVASSTSTGFGWTTYSSTFTALAATTDIQLTGFSTSNGYYIGLDNVIVTDAPSVPEPGSLLLVGLGGLAVPLLARRRRRI